MRVDGQRDRATCLWRIVDFPQKSVIRHTQDYKAFYNQCHCHSGLAGVTPAQSSGAPAPPFASLDLYRWRQHCHGLFQTPIAA
jgi:hypothetical protein